MTALNYEPITTVPATMHAQVDRPDAGRNRCECPTCGKVYLPTQFINGKPSWSRRYGCHVIGRKCLCDFCGHWINWLESCNESGVPLGMVLSGPGITRGAGYTKRLLDEHPQAIGVDQV